MIFAELAIPDNFWVGATGSAIFGFIGLVLLVIGMVVGYKVFDKLTPGLHFAEELKKGNVAVAIVVAATMFALLISIAFIAANVVH